MKAVSAWTTADGKVFTDAKLAAAHELALVRREALLPLAAKLSDELESKTGGDVRVDAETIMDVLMENGDALRDALNAKPTSNRGRKAKEEPKAA